MSNRQHKSGRRALGAALAMVVAVVMLLLSATTALGKTGTTVLDYDANRTKNPVADNITRLNINKLEKGSRDYVKGAHLCIIEKETGRIVTEWVTGEDTHEVARNTGDKSSLNVETVYVLREIEAPEGYNQAADTEFVLHSSDQFNTTGEIISGPDAEFDVIQGNGDEQAFVINLYDEAVSYEEVVEYRKRTVTATSEASSDEVSTQPQEQQQQQQARRQTTTGSLMQTGVYISWGVVTLLTVSLIAGLAVYRKRHKA